MYIEGKITQMFPAKMSILRLLRKVSHTKISCYTASGSTVLTDSQWSWQDVTCASHVCGIPKIYRTSTRAGVCMYVRVLWATQLYYVLYVRIQDTVCTCSMRLLNTISTRHGVHATLILTLNTFTRQQTRHYSNWQMSSPVVTPSGVCRSICVG